MYLRNQEASQAKVRDREGAITSTRGACAPQTRNPASHRELVLVLRAIWKGSISFGLVNIPITLYPATKKLN